ncbi:hypothetical protein AB0C07_27595 [Actinoplanes missouriensis]|uniref:hypothetical protein n=1 Tax=Actinoplanes missouriensis TaxID=1866 RepID=UPI00340CBB54
MASREDVSRSPVAAQLGAVADRQQPVGGEHRVLTDEGLQTHCQVSGRLSHMVDVHC